MPSKLKSKEEIEIISKQLKSINKTIVTTNGAFDILHPAHINLLEKAKLQGDILILLLNSDESIKRYKGPTRPILNQKDRTYLLSALQVIDHIVIFEEDTPLNLIKTIKPHKHVKGGAGIPERIKSEKDLLALWNAKYIQLPLEKGYSSTNIIEKIKSFK
jgi:rfaE bifunctional protein nucleotidyltransferase chain/domain